MSGCTSVVFTRNCKATHFLTIMLRHLGLRAIPISGRMSQVKKLQRDCLRNPVKECYLAYILTEMSGCTSVVFTRNCKATHFLTIMLRHLGLRAIPISGRMSQSNRVGALNQFKAGECNVLICTNAAMRGFDIPSVELVIYYDIPTDVKEYIHQMGRTARSAFAIFLVNQYEGEWFLNIENIFGKKFPEFHCQHEQVLLFMERIIDANKNISGGHDLFLIC
nr:dead-box atp-dependent rna helicase 10 [Quercus suber]